MSYDVAKLRALLSAATPLPWSSDPELGGWVTGDDGLGVCEAIGHSDADGGGWRTRLERDANAALISQLVTAAPELLDDLERISALYERAKAKVNEQSDELDRLRRLEAADLAFYALIERQDAGEEITPDEWVAAMMVQRACQIEARRALANEAAPGRCASAILRCAADWNASGQTLEAWLAHAELRHGQAEAVAAIRGTKETPNG